MLAQPISLRRAGARRGASDNAGFVMLEVLVGGLIFAIGVIGIVSLQASVAQSQSRGKFRGDATYLADELAGLMWADRPNVAKYLTAQCAGYARCNDWAAKVASELPSGTSNVTANAAGANMYDVSITWTTGSGNQSYATQVAVTP